MVTISDLMICCFFSEIGEEVSPGRSQVTLSSVKPGTHTTFFFPPLQSRVEKKTPKKTNKQKTDISTAIIPLSGQCSQSLAESTDHELIARFFFFGHAPPEHTGQHSQLIGCQHRSDAGFPACPTDRSWTFSQPLSDRLMYTRAECQTVSVEPADIQALGSDT